MPTDSERIDELQQHVGRLIAVVAEMLEGQDRLLATSQHALAALADVVKELNTRVDALEQRAAATAWKRPH